MEGSSRGQLAKGGPSACDLDEVLTNPHRKKLAFLRNGYMCLGPGQIL